MARQLTAALVLTSAAAALSAVPARAQTAPGALDAPEVKLTQDILERLLTTLPPVTELASQQQASVLTAMTGGAAMPQLTPEQAKEMEALLAKHGFTFEEFALYTSALMATYFALDPAALDRAIPDEKNPRLQALLNDPKVAKEQKDAVRAQLAFVHENRDAFRQQLTALASEPNKALVKPMLSTVKKLFAELDARTRKALAPAQTKGPRRQ